MIKTWWYANEHDQFRGKKQDWYKKYLLMNLMEEKWDQRIHNQFENQPNQNPNSNQQTNDQNHTIELH